MPQKQRYGEKRVSPETKAVIAAVLAGVGSVGAAFGAAAVVGITRPASSADSDSSGARKTVPMAKTAPVGLGKAAFASNCASCHGEKAEGGFGPDLRGLHLPDAALTAIIAKGVSGKMPAFGARLSDEKIKSLVAYVQSIKK